MFAIVSAFLSYLSSLFRPKHELALEILALRHQILVLKRQTPRPKGIDPETRKRRYFGVGWEDPFSGDPVDCRHCGRREPNDPERINGSCLGAL